MHRAASSPGLVTAIAILAIGTLILPTTGRAQSRMQLRVPRRVSAGEIVPLSMPEVLPGVEEMEVLLSLDDGRTYPYRVTQDGLEPGRVVRWEVPNVAFAAARVRLRYRISGREIDGAASERFTIVANPARAPDRLLPRENDREDVAGHGEPGPGSLAADRGPSFSAASADAVADPDPPDPDLTPRESRRVPAPGTVAATGSPALSPHTPRSFTPLRN